MRERDRLLVARFMYANGLPYITDAEYDILAKEVSDTGTSLSPIYENDCIPYEALENVLGYDKDDVDKLISDKDETARGNTDYSDLLNDSRCLSIHSCSSFYEAQLWFREHAGTEVVISTKIDGFNTRRGYSINNDKLCYKIAITRGSSGYPFVITDHLQHVSPDNILNTNIEGHLTIYSETVITDTTISEINEKYMSDYVSPRGLALAIARTSKFDKSDISKLRSFVFRIDYGNTLQEGLEYAKLLGFETVPYVLYTYHEKSYEAFKEEIELIILALKTSMDTLGIVTDGMVAQVNNYDTFTQGSITNDYSTENIALKIGLWEPGVYTSTVLRLDISQSGDRACCIALVEPVLTNSGKRLCRVNCFNPRTIISRNILPGSKITFEYKNETTINLI